MFSQPIFGTLLKGLRKKGHLTQLRLVNRLAGHNYPYAVSTLSMWETGHRLPSDVEVIAVLSYTMNLSELEEQALFDAYIEEFRFRAYDLYDQKREELKKRNR